MRDYIKKQLMSLDVAKIDYYDTEEHFYFIPKYTGASYSINKMYLVKIAANNAYGITQEYFKAYVSQTKGGQIYVDMLACNPVTKQDLTYCWSGWININDLEQLAVL